MSTFARPPRPSKQRNLIRRKDHVGGGFVTIDRWLEAYIVWRFVESDPLLWSELQIFECSVSQEAEIGDDHVEPAQLQYRRKDQGDDLIEINLTEEGEKLSCFLKC